MNQAIANSNFGIINFIILHNLKLISLAVREILQILNYSTISKRKQLGFKDAQGKLQ